MEDEKNLVKLENQISYLVKARLAGFVLQVEEIRSTLSMLCARFLPVLGSIIFVRTDVLRK